MAFGELLDNALDRYRRKKLHGVGANRIFRFLFDLKTEAAGEANPSNHA